MSLFSEFGWNSWKMSLFSEFGWNSWKTIGFSPALTGKAGVLFWPNDN